MEEATHNPLYLEGIRLFNESEFFEAHDVWEELWAGTRGDSRKFYQGLIQSAVALHHFGNGNAHGARKLYRSSRAYLLSYGKRYQGLNLERFFIQFEACFAELIGSEEEKSKMKLNPRLIPVIALERVREE